MSSRRPLPAGWLAEREGFEPSIQVTPYTGLANQRLRPLGHLSRTSSSPSYVAEEEGFEPSEGVNPLRFSRPPPSTARPLLRIRLVHQPAAVPGETGRMTFEPPCIEDGRRGIKRDRAAGGSLPPPAARERIPPWQPPGLRPARPASSSSSRSPPARGPRSSRWSSSAPAARRGACGPPLDGRRVTPQGRRPLAEILRRQSPLERSRRGSERRPGAGPRFGRVYRDRYAYSGSSRN